MAEGRRVQLSDHGQKVVVTNIDDLENALGNLLTASQGVQGPPGPAGETGTPGAGSGISGTGSAAAVDLGAWYIYRSSSGAYYGVNKLTGEASYNDANDVEIVWDQIVAAMPGTASTANTERSGGSIEFGPHVFYTGGPLEIVGIRSVHVYGQGWLQQTIIEQNAEFPSSTAVFMIGTSGDPVHLQGIEMDHMQIRGRIDSGHTRGGGIRAFCSFSNFHDLVIEGTNDTAFLLNGTVSETVLAFSVVLDNIQISGFNAVGTNTAYGIDFGAGTSDCDIMNCIVHQDSEGQNRGLAGIRVKGGTTRINNTHVYFCKEQGIINDGNGLFSVIDTISESNGLQGLYLGGPDSVKVIGGGYYSNGQSSAVANIYATSVDQLVIADVIFAKQRGSTTNVPRNIQLGSCSSGSIHGCVFADAEFDHVLVESSTYIDVYGNQFRDGITYTGTSGLTPAIAVRLNGSTSNCKVHDNIISGTTMDLEELAGMTGNYNEFYNNKVGGGTVTLVGAQSRKATNFDLTNSAIA